MNDLLHEAMDEGQLLLIALPSQIVEIGKNFATAHLVLKNEAKSIFFVAVGYCCLQHSTLFSLHLESHLYPAHIHHYFVVEAFVFKLGQHEHILIL